MVNPRRKQSDSSIDSFVNSKKKIQEQSSESSEDSNPKKNGTKLKLKLRSRSANKHKNSVLKKESSSDENSVKSGIIRQKPKRRREIVESSDNSTNETSSETSNSESDSDSSVDDHKKLRSINGTNLRKRKNMKNKSGDYDGGNMKKRKLRGKKFTKSRKKEEESPAKKANQGRKAIRHVLKRDELTEETKNAELQEKERRKRLENLEDNKIVEVDLHQSPSNVVPVPITKRLVLQKDPLVEVHSNITVHLKPHQVEGIQFIWNNLVETTKLAEEGKGGGCILAHCMGLGKTLQTISCVHTILRSEHLSLKTALVVAPLNTLLNWIHEFNHWVPDDSPLKLYNLHEYFTTKTRLGALKEWSATGGVMVMGYDMFRILASGIRIKHKPFRKSLAELLLDPGPDLIVCDEGHQLKNSESNTSMIVNKVKTTRRLILTGTPLQNNLMEYQCMVNFVKPNLLGSVKEFRNRFVNPIQNGQHSDSTPHDVRLMKKRCHVLHNMLQGFVQRKDYTALSQYLCEKQEYIVKVRLSSLQIKLYRHYLDTQTNRGCNPHAVIQGSRDTGLFSDYQNLMRIWTHPRVLQLHTLRLDNMNNFLDDTSEEEAVASSEEDKDWEETKEEEEEMHLHHKSGSINKISDEETVKVESSEKSNSNKTTTVNGALVIEDSDVEENTKKRRKCKRLRESDEESSLSSFSSDESDKESQSEEEKLPRRRRGAGRYRLRGGNGKDDDGPTSSEIEQENQANASENNSWYSSIIKEHAENIQETKAGGKLAVLFEILRLAKEVDDKVLVFSQSLLSLDLIEEMLSLSTAKAVSLEENVEVDGTDSRDCYQKWYKNIDYFRMDGSSVGKLRQRWINEFNDESDRRARLFLISTKAGSLGVNLVAANRVIIFDASWNPTHDIQSIFRVYRFGQTKPCYIYRLIAQGTMEEKIYDRQVTKQSLSFRVVDEQQINRHFTAHDLHELYTFTPSIYSESEEKTPTLPKDKLLAELLVGTQTKTLISSHHKHDSLLDHQETEELTEEERKAAWEEYENEKKGIRKKPAPTTSFNYVFNRQSLLSPEIVFLQQRLQQQQQEQNIKTALLGQLNPAIMELPLSQQSQAQSIFSLIIKTTETLQKAVRRVKEYNPINSDEIVKDLKKLPMYQRIKEDGLKMLAIEMKIRRQQLRLQAEKEEKQAKLQLEWLQSTFQNLISSASSQPSQSSHQPLSSADTQSTPSMSSDNPNFKNAAMLARKSLAFIYSNTVGGKQTSLPGFIARSLSKKPDASGSSGAPIVIDSDSETPPLKPSSLDSSKNNEVNKTSIFVVPLDTVTTKPDEVKPVITTSVPLKPVQTGLAPVKTCPAATCLASNVKLGNAASSSKTVTVLSTSDPTPKLLDLSSFPQNSPEPLVVSKDVEKDKEQCLHKSSSDPVILKDDGDAKVRTGKLMKEKVLLRKKTKKEESSDYEEETSEEEDWEEIYSKNARSNCRRNRARR